MAEFESRRVDIELMYDGANISRDIAPFFIDLTYTDNAHGEDDDVSLTLEDRKGLWRGSWFPDKGASISVSLITRNWNKRDDVLSLPCGKFQIDEIECSGPPSQVTIKAVSTPVSSSAKREKKTKAWENITLSGIVSEITGKHGLSSLWDSSEDPFYERKDQVDTPDLLFVKKLCEDAGLAAKITDGQMVVFSEEEYEKKSPVDTLVYGEKRLTFYRFRVKTAGTFKAAKVTYHDALKDEKFEVYSAAETPGNNGEVLVVNEKVDSVAEAQRLAKKKLYEANKREVSGSLDLMGDLRFVGGSTIRMKGWGKFDGTYFIERAVHSVSRSGGYTTSLEIRQGKKPTGEKVAGERDENFEVYSESSSS